MRPRARKLLGLIVVLAIGSPAASAVAEREELDPFAPSTVACGSFPLAADGSRRQRFESQDAVGGIAAMPPRIVTKLQPGERERYCVGFQNRSARPVDLVVTMADVTADEAGVPSSQRDAEDRGASRWLTLPTRRIDALQPGDIAWLEVDVAVPLDAPGGSSYASVVATEATPIEEQEGSGVQAIPSVASQLFFDIPGDAQRRGRLVRVRSPNVVWWDGLDLGELPVFERLRGLGVATMHFEWENTGDFTSTVGGRVVVRSDLSGRAVTRIDVPDQVVLRGSSRKFSVTWSRDIPLLGRFTPVLELRGEGARVERHELEPIWVIPSWWYVIALACAIAVPVWTRRRSQRRYHELLARLEAAEGQGAAGWVEDDDWADHS